VLVNSDDETRGVITDHHHKNVPGERAHVQVVPKGVTPAEAPLRIAIDDIGEASFGTC
jgi:hypothetical protein